MDYVKFENGKCSIGEPVFVNLEAPLEAFGNVKLVNAFGELPRETVLRIAINLGIETTVIGEQRPDSKITILQPVPVPYDEIRWTAISRLQYAWYEQIPGGPTTNVVKNRDEREAHYLNVVESIKTGGYKMNDKIKKESTPRASSRVFTYELNATLPESITKKVANEQTTNHDAIIVSVMQKHTGPCDLGTIVSWVDNTGRYETKDPLEKSVRWHLVKMEKEGVVLTKDVTPVPVAPAPKPTAAEEKNAAAKLDAMNEPAKVETSAKPPAVQGTKSGKKEVAVAAKK
jgi:hypothetical protein